VQISCHSSSPNSPGRPYALEDIIIPFFPDIPGFNYKNFKQNLSLKRILCFSNSFKSVELKIPFYVQYVPTK
jgi:hypothetical protein